MATIGYQYPTWLDVASRTHNDQIQAVVEVASDASWFIRDGMVREGNLTTGHRSTQRTGLPSGTFRKLNSGVQPEKSTTVPVTDAAGMLETYSEVDKALANLNGNSAAWFASEESAFIEGLTQTAESTTIYGDTDQTPEKFMGLAPRYSAGFASSNAAYTDRKRIEYNVINAQGVGSNNAGQSGTNTSVWFVTWGERTCHYFFTKGSKAGLERQPLGEDTKVASDGSMHQVFRTHYKWDIGLAVPDWRATCRVANIGTAVSGTATTNTLHEAVGDSTFHETLIQALHRMRRPATGGNTFMYCSEAVHSYLDRVAQAKSNVNLTIGNFAGEDVLTFRGIPIRQTDAILDTEAAVTFA